MSLLNLGLVLLSSVFHSLWNVLTQTSKNSQFFSGLKGLFIILFGLVFLSLLGTWNYPKEILFWTTLSGILHGVYILSLSRAYKTQDISYVYPIARSAPVFVPVFAWLFLNEVVTFKMAMAIIMILMAIYILHFDGKLKQGFQNLFDAILHKDLKWAFLTLALVVSYSLVDKRGMEVVLSYYPDRFFVNGLMFFFLESLVGFSLALTYLFLVFPRAEIVQVWKGEWKIAMIAGLATVGSYGLICVVLQMESVSAVVSLRQTSVILVVYWGCWKLGEPFGQKRLLASILIFIGVALIGI